MIIQGSAYIGTRVYARGFAPGALVCGATTAYVSFVGNQPAIIMQSDGDVGIGTITPTAVLEVTGGVMLKNISSSLVWHFRFRL